MIFKRIVKRSTDFIKRRKKRIYSLIKLCILLSLIVVLFYNFAYPTLVEKTFEYSDLSMEKFGVDIGRYFIFIVDSPLSFLDFRFKKNLFDGGLPIYDLEFSENDINHFNEIVEIFLGLGYRNDSINVWRKANLRINGQDYDVKIKLHGDGAGHWMYEAKSYRIKSSENYINNIGKFNLMAFEERSLRPKITRVVSSYLGLYDIGDDVVVLRINGVPQGLYYLQEFLDDDFLENNRCSSCTIIKRTDDYLVDHYSKGNNGLMVLPESIHPSPFDYDISSVDTLKTELDQQKSFYRINDLFKTVQEEDYEKLLEFFDIDQLSSFEAMRRIVGNTHGATGDNLRIVYSASTSKFYPVPLNEDVHKIKLIKGGFENYINRVRFLDEQIFIPMFYLLNKNDPLRYETNKKIYGFIENHKGDFLKEQREIIDKYIPYAMSYNMNRMSPTMVKFRMNYFEEILGYNLNLLEQNLKYASMYFNVVKKDQNVKIEIIPDSISQLEFEKMKLVLDKEYFGKINVKLKTEKDTLISSASINVDNNTVNLMNVLQGIPFAAGLDDDLYPTKRVYILEVSFVDDISSISNMNNIKLLGLDVSIINEVTRELLPEDDIYFNIADGDGYYLEINEFTFEEFKEKYPALKWQFNEDGLTLKSGTYTLMEDLIIPSFSKFNIEGGTKLFVGEGKSVVSYSPINIKGTVQQNVVVTALDKNKPFGTFGVIGEDGVIGKEDYKCDINYLEISYGSEKFIEGISFLGALSIHKCDTTISNSKIHDNKADDGLNIKYGDVMLVNNEFFNNFADQIDLDFTSGIVKENKFFVEKGEDRNGDGLDLSGSSVIISNNLFKGFSDKGVSIGERTEVVLFENDFNDNNWGSAVKDSSHAFFINNNFAGNNIAINAYQKKQLFDGGFVYEFDNTYNGNGEEYASDKKSERYGLVLQSEGLALVEQLVEKEERDLLFKFLGQRAESAVGIGVK